VLRWLAIVCCIVLLSRPAAAEWQVKPFVGIAFGGNTSFLDYENAAGRTHSIFGVNAMFLGEVLGIEADVARAPGFFQADKQLVLSSSATTLTGNVVLAMPRRLFQYTLRPYFVAGAGIMRAQIAGRFGTLQVASALPAMDLGGGATGFLTDRIGLNWELRHFRSFKGKGDLSGVSVSDEQLSFWRATMAVALRY
jgi:hypothetical protein